MKEHPILGTLILVVIIWVSASLLRSFTATQDLPVLSLYAFYSICVQDGAGQLVDESCRRELVDAQNWGLLPLVFGKATPTPAPMVTPIPFPSAPSPTATPTATASPGR